MKKILFLYTELAGYFVACVNELAKHDVEVYIVRWPVNKEAPFQFEFADGVTVYERDAYTNETLQQQVDTINPDIIYCSGWVDKGYVSICKSYRNSIPTLMSMDNQWHGTLKQRMACLAAPFTLHKAFNGAWVPGVPQKEYALKLGFKDERIKIGFYSADTTAFAPLAKSKVDKAGTLPKRFLYVGRYIPQKGIDKLFAAFLELQEEGFDDWELHCLGTGDLFDQRPIHPKIKHWGFVQPGDMKTYLEQTSVFVLPSDFEPWGVVTHEMATAGFPMIISSAVGSATRFVDDGINGFIFQQGDQQALKSAMKKMMEKNEEEIREMAIKSYTKGMSWTPEMWAEIAKGGWV